jgi:protein O-mannosyl-transferase
MPRFGPKPSPVLVAGAGLVLGALAAYHNSFSGPFLFDDVPAIPGNPTITRLATALAPPSGGLTVSGRPILNLSFAINYALGGTDVLGYHLGNLLIHICAGLALFGIVRRTLPAVGISGFKFQVSSFFIALLWLVHPLQTESVTYVVQRAESLMGLFYLLTLYCFIRYAENPSDRSAFRFQVSGFSLQFRSLSALLSVAACLLGMCTKEVMVSAPVIVFLYDRTFVSGSFKAAWNARKRYYGALAATWLVLAVVAGTSGSRGGSAGFGTGIPWQLYLLTQFGAIVRYVGLALWPHPLVFDYGGELVRSTGAVLPQLLVVLGLAGVTAWGVVRNTALGFAGIAFLAVLAPSSSIIPVATETIAEHRMYLALAPVLAVVVGGLGALSRRLPGGPEQGRWLPGILAVAAVVLAAATVSRNETYRSEEALWRDTLAKRPGNARAHYDLGVLCLGKADTAGAKAQFDEAIRLAPDYADAYVNRGNLLQKEGRLEEAVADFGKAIEFKPGSAEAHNDLGMALATTGAVDRAIPQFAQAVRLNPGFADAHANLGTALASSGNLSDGLAELQEAVRLDPGSIHARTNLGLVLRAAGREDEGRAELERASQLQSGIEHGGH